MRLLFRYRYALLVGALLWSVSFWGLTQISTAVDGIMNRHSTDIVHVLLWNKIDHWFSLQHLEILNEDSKSCPFKCNFTTNRNYLSMVDAIVFDNTLSSYRNRSDYKRAPIPLPETYGQLWVNYHFESPSDHPLLAEPRYMDFFDLNVTLDQTESETNLPVTRFCDWVGSMDTLLLPPPNKTDDKLVAHIFNYCPIRRGRAALSYVEELSKYLPVHSYGFCLHNKGAEIWIANHGENMKKVIEIFKEYKFALVFEAYNETDYVTEYLMAAFQAGTVPIYMGAPNIDNWVPGDDSIIKTSDWNNPEELADYILYLKSDSEKYYSYFDWKKKPFSPSFQQKLQYCAATLRCRLCEKITRLRKSRKLVDEPYALKFDGSTYVKIGNFTPVQMTDTYSIAAWINFDSAKDWRIIDKGIEGVYTGYGLDVIEEVVDTRKLAFLRLCAGGSCTTSSCPLETNKWHHVAVSFISWEGKNKGLEPGVCFFINGKMEYKKIDLLPTNVNDVPLNIGKAGEGAAFWRGYIDEVSIWSQPFTEKQVRQLMFKRVLGYEANLIAYWGFNEGKGDVVYDHGPHSLHGKILGNLQWEKVGEVREFDFGGRFCK